jgi:hypothetical protein
VPASTLTVPGTVDAVGATYEDVPFSRLLHHLVAGLVSSENLGLIRRLLPNAVPWVTLLPEADFDVFVAELVDVAQGAAALGNLAPLAVCLTQWRHSAEVYADPVLLDILTRESEGDLGPVPSP